MLILSRFAGAAAECKPALLVNPYDSESVGNAIARALTMSPEERRQRHTLLMRTLLVNDIDHWVDDYLEALTGPRPEITSIAPSIASPIKRRAAGPGGR